MGVQQAPEQWVVAVTLRKNLDVFLWYECGPNAAAVLLGTT